MKLVQLIDEMPYFSEEARTIIQFNRILMRDKGSEGDSDGRKKKFALKELAFVYFYCSFDGRFQFYDTEKERIEAIKSVLGLPKEWVIDSVIEDAIKMYSYLTETESMALVKEARRAIKKLKEFIEDVDLNATTKSGTLVFSPKDLQSVIKDMPYTIESLNKAKEIVQKELGDKLGKSDKKVRSLVEKDFNKLEEDYRI